MPPTRRRGGNAAARSQQSTLAFGVQSRVTKPTTAPSTTKKTKDIEEVHDVDTSDPDQVPVAPPEGSSQPHIAEIVVREQAKAEIQQPLSEEDKRALKVTDADLKRYWRSEEAKRKAPRVHQEGLSLNEKILRHFDLSSQYGPCIGIARLKRWRRAHMLNLNPPIEVLAVLLKNEDDLKQRAYIDELLS
ncbi:hypothetical protein DTO271G3_8570 [Paecilomyces variotii]|nr:hypothetical protein DTO271G3_8570 [Paecilomyces variotii]